MRPSHWVVRLSAVAALWVAPAAAWACPVCAGRETDTSLVLTLVGMMIAVPYGISVVAIRVIRKADKESAWLDADAADKPEVPRQ